MPDILRGGYIYAFLSSSIGKALIQKHIFGSVIQHIEPPHLKLIPIPVIEDSIIDNIHKLVIEYSKKVGKAIENERQAISMIEQEIESIIRKSKFPQNPKRSVRFSGKRTKRSVQKRKARNTQKAETKVL